MWWLIWEREWNQPPFAYYTQKSDYVINRLLAFAVARWPWRCLYLFICWFCLDEWVNTSLIILTRKTETDGDDAVWFSIENHLHLRQMSPSSICHVRSGIYRHTHIPDTLLAYSYAVEWDPQNVAFYKDIEFQFVSYCPKSDWNGVIRHCVILNCTPKILVTTFSYGGPVVE